MQQGISKDWLQSQAAMEGDGLNNVGGGRRGKMNEDLKFRRPLPPQDGKTEPTKLGTHFFLHLPWQWRKKINFLDI